MSDEPWIKLVRSYLAGASDASRRYDTEAARYYLAQAADAAAEIDDDKERRLAWSIVAKGAVNVRDTELSQQLARKLIRLDRKLANPRWVIVDLLSYGSSLHQSLQHLEAEDVYRQAFDLALEIKSWQNTAAAGSNYAMAIAARGDVKEARKWAQRALEQLEREPNADTELRTRAFLLRVGHAEGEPVAECLAKARSLVDQFAGRLTGGLCRVLQEALEPLLKSYFSENPGVDTREWVGEHFPELMEDAHVRALLQR